MKSRLLGVCILAALVVAGNVGVASAATISIVPSAVSVTAGDTPSADIVIGLDPNEVLGAFDIFALFDDSVLQVTGVTWPSNPGQFPVSGADTGFLSVSGDPNSPLLLQGSMDIPTDPQGFADFAAAHAAQGSGFTLATINFLAIADGRSTLGISLRAGGLYDFEGFPLRVPEPGSVALLAMGLGAAIIARRRRG